ncbi:MAG: hypothetical protein MEP57_05035 [Microvirga sp.]|nr:hypothetical protein [Microvirga sp.]
MAGPTREERLKAALRENLKRRKAQARLRKSSPRDADATGRETAAGERAADEAEPS